MLTHTCPKRNFTKSHPVFILVYSFYLQNFADENLNTPDLLDNIGRALYDISFMTPRAFQIDKSLLYCGQQTWQPIVRRFDIRNILDKFQYKILQNSPTEHPLEALGEHFLPENLRSELNQFQFRSKVALSCLLEKGQSIKLEKTLNSLISTSVRKINILEEILNEKINDLGQNMEQHSCVSHMLKTLHTQ